MYHFIMKTLCLIRPANVCTNKHGYYSATVMQYVLCGTPKVPQGHGLKSEVVGESGTSCR